ncbi:hypothetical protein [Bifidobacterium magnum]|uniref:Rod shape-determining protein RodA n=1 Tax=Bifidobacterium magnum TaxID=1692 RepID=A0A087BA41_9BIFI|nr:hypothetical protein [Bifidobacterium magnum]KFI67891.1 hypothetical protein BMAGN_0882 [Bifidobacterium magnum]
MKDHPHVSENHEGAPWFEWIVAGMVALAAVLAALGKEMAATLCIALTAIVTGIIQLVLRDRSPWKVRSVPFDATVGIGSGAAILLLYFSIRLLSL